MKTWDWNLSYIRFYFIPMLCLFLLTSVYKRPWAPHPKCGPYILVCIVWETAFRLSEIGVYISVIQPFPMHAFQVLLAWSQGSLLSIWMSSPRSTLHVGFLKVTECKVYPGMICGEVLHIAKTHFGSPSHLIFLNVRWYFILFIPFSFSAKLCIFLYFKISCGLVVIFHIQLPIAVVNLILI